MKDIVKYILDTELKHLHENCPDNISDLVFLEIEKSFLPTYRNEIKHRKQSTVNQTIGKFIKTYWELINGSRCHRPKSKLIKSYQRH